MADFTTLRFVDQVGDNYLFRGGAPLIDEGNDNYSFDTNLFAALATANPLMPTFFNLVILCLFHPNEVSKIEAEMTYFKKYPEVGLFNLWDTNGTPLCYFQTDPLERDYLVGTLEQWLDDPLIWRTAKLRSWLEGAVLPTPVPRPGLPLVFYVHCDGGCDRTAELIGAYRMRYMSYSWIDMWSEQPCQRPLGCNNYRALQWYAFWLNMALGFQLSGMGEVDNGCYDGGPWPPLHKPCSA